MAAPLPLSLCLFTHNEAESVVQCLALLRPFVSEVLLFNFHSTDQLLEATQPYNVILQTIDWTDHFSQLRNLALEQATQPWVLFLNGDEILTPEGLTCLPELLETEAEIIYCRRLNEKRQVEEMLPRLIKKDPTIHFVGHIY